MKIYRDLKGAFDTAFYDGKIEGINYRNNEIAKSLKENGVSIDIIIKTTGLTLKQIDLL